MPNTKALVTMCLGERYLAQWKKYCHSNWENYAKKHNYDLIIIDNSLDTSEKGKSRPPHWQKCLILNQNFSEKYERIVWIDSDIICNTELAPCIVEGVPAEKIGAVRSWGAEQSPKRLARNRQLRHWGISEPTQRDTYQKYGIQTDYNEIVQTGVLVLSPKYHQNILEKAYYEHIGVGEWEMFPLSYEILKANAVHWIDERFNCVWGEQIALHYPFLLKRYEKSFFRRKTERILEKIGVPLPVLHSTTSQCLTNLYLNHYFIHFAGGLLADTELLDLENPFWEKWKKA